MQYQSGLIYTTPSPIKAIHANTTCTLAVIAQRESRTLPARAAADAAGRGAGEVGGVRSRILSE